MGYRWKTVVSDCRKRTLQLTGKTPKTTLFFNFHCFEDMPSGLSLQNVFPFSTRNMTNTVCGGLVEDIVLSLYLQEKQERYY